MKTYDYIIILKKRNNSKVNGISQLMLLLALVAFISSAVALPAYSTVPLLISLLILGWWIFC